MQYGCSHLTNHPEAKLVLLAHGTIISAFLLAKSFSNKLEIKMSVIDFAKSAISNSNFEKLEEILQGLTKDQIQELAFYYKATSVIINMSGTWVEECKANLLDASGKIILKDVQIERSFKGWLEQSYDDSNLHSAAIAVLDTNFTYDYDEDYFSSGEMLFGKDYGYGASSSIYEADCTSEERYFNQDDIDEEDVDEDFDIDDCDIDDNNSELSIHSAYIIPDRVVIELDGFPSINLKISGDISYLTRWFIFSLLFNSSGKTIDDLEGNSLIISEFMSEEFKISV